MIKSKVGWITVWNLFGIVGLCFASIANSLAEEPGEKAKKYHSALQKRPKPGYLFDRFYDSWLESDSLEGLQSFLEDQVKVDQSTANRLLLAFFLSKQNKDTEALREFDRALEKEPGNAATWYEKARVETRLLNYAAAIETLSKAEAVEPEKKLSLEIGKLKARLQIRSGQSEQAVKTWQAMLAAAPDDQELQEDIIELQINEGAIDEAVKTSKALIALTKDPYQMVMRRMRLGDIFHRSGRREEALEAYAANLDQAGQKTWLEREVLAQIDELFRRSDDLSGLDEFLQTLQKKHPKRVALMLRRAELLVELDETEEAKKAFEVLLGLTPGRRDIRESFVKGLAKLGETEDAITQQEALISLQPEDRELLIGLASLQHDAEKDEAASKTLEKFLAGDDRVEADYLRVARMYQQFALLDKAETAYRNLSKTFPGSTAARETLAAFLHDQGEEKRDEAIELWKKAATSGDVAQMIRVTRTLSSRNEHDTALSLLKPAYQENQNFPVFLDQLTEVAYRCKTYSEAIPWVRQRVRLVSDPFDLETAMRSATRIIEKAQKRDELIDALETEPLRIPAEKCLLAELLYLADRPEEGFALLDTLSQEQPLIALAETVRLHKLGGDWESASQALAKLVALPGQRKVPNLQALVDLYEKLLDAGGAAQWIAAWKQLTPGSVTPWLREAKLAQKVGDWDRGIEILRRANQRIDDEDILEVELANAYFEMGKLADAERLYWRLYENAAELSDKLSWIRKLTMMSAEQGTTDVLIERLKERHATNRTSIDPILALAEVYARTNDLASARQWMIQASRLEPENLTLLLQIASSHERESNFDAALETLQEALPHDRRGTVRRRLANLYFADGQFEKGFATLLEKGRKPTSDEVVDGIQRLISFGEWERAAKFAAQYKEDHSKDYRIAYLHAVALEEAELDDRAFEAFLELAQITEESEEVLQAAKRLAAQYQHPRYSGQIYIPASYRNPAATQNAPQEALTTLSAQSQSRAAYNYRSTNVRGRVYSVNQSQTGAVALPGDLAGLHAYSQVHFIGLATNHKPKAKLSDEWLAKLGEHFDKRLWFRLLKAKQEAGDKFTNRDFLAAYPDDIVAHAYVALSNYRPELETARRSIELLRKPYPELATILALNSFYGTAPSSDGKDPKSEPVDNELFANALGRLPETEPNSVIIYQLNNLLQLPREQLPDKQRDQVESVLLDWYPKLRRQPGANSSQLFYMIAQMYVRNKQWEKYIDFLIAELDSASGQSNQNQRPMPMMYWGHMHGSPQVAQRLNFPPRQIPGVPNDITQLLSQSYYQYSSGRSNLNKEERAAFRKAIDEVKNPIIATLLTRNLDDPDLLKIKIKQLTELDPPILGGLLLAAAYATREEDIETTDRLLLRINQLPMKPDARKIVDAAILDRATKADDGSAMQKAGREAALRINVSKMDRYQRQRVIEIYGKLGMEEQVSQLMSVTHRGTPVRHPTVQHGQINGDAIRTQLRQLLNDGKKEAAIKLMSRDGLRMAAARLGQNGSNYDYYMREIRKLLEAKKIVAEVLTASDPGTEANYVKRARFASLCEGLGDYERAKSLYEGIREERPDDSTILTRLIYIYASEAPEVALQILKSPDYDNLAIYQNFNNWIQQSQQFPDQYFALIDLLTEYLEHKSEEEEDHTHGQYSYSLQYILTQMCGNQYFTVPRNSTQVQISSLFEIDPVLNNYSNELNKVRDELIVKRRKHVESFAAACEKIPAIAGLAFAVLGALAELDGEEIASSQDWAERALAAWKKETNNHGWSNNINFSHYSNRRYQPLVWPEQFLARYAWLTKNRAWVEKELEHDANSDTSGPPNTIKKNKAERLKERLSLYFSEESKFIATAEKLVEEQKAGSQMPPVVNAIVEIWSARQLDFNINEIVLHPERLNRKTGYRNDKLDNYVEQLGKNIGEAATWQFLEKLAEVYLGPKEGRAAFVAKHGGTNNLQSGTEAYAVYVYSQYMEKLLTKPALGFRIMEQLSDSGMWRSSNRLYDQYRNSDFLRSKQLEESLANSPFLAEVEEFRAYAGTKYRIRYHESLLEGFVEYFRRQKKERKEELVKWLQARDPRSFGTRYLLASFSGGDFKQDKKAILNLFGEHKEQVRTLPEERQIELSRHLAKVLGSQKPSGLDEGGSEIWDWIETNCGKGDKEAVDAFLTATEKEASSIVRQHSDLGKYAGKLMAEAEKEDPSKAVQVFVKAVQIRDAAQKRGSWRRGYSIGYTFEGDLLEEFLEASKSTREIGILFQIVRHEGIPPFEIDLSDLTRYIGSDFQSDLDDLANNDITILDGLEKFLIYENAPEVSLLMPIFFGGLQSCNSGELSKLTAKIEAAEKPSKVLAALAAAIRLRQFGSGGDQAKDHGDAVSKAYLAALKDEAVPLQLRVPLAYHPFYQTRGKFGESLVLSACEVLGKAWEAGIPTREEATRYLFWELNRLPHSDRWEEVAAQLAPGWKKTYLMNAARSGSSYLNNEIVLQSAVFHYRRGEPAVANQLILRYESSVQPTALLLEMTRHGQHSSAARLLRKRSNDFQISYGRGQTYDAQLHEQLPKMLEAVPQEAVRFFGETIVKSCPDSSELPKGVPSRGDRIIDLAHRFGEVEFTNDQWKDNVLRVLISEAKALPPLKEALHEVAKLKDLDALFAMSSSSDRRNRFQLYSAAARASLMAGEPQSNAKLIAALTDPSHINESVRWELIENLDDSLWSATLKVKDSPERLKQMIPGFKPLLSITPEGRYDARDHEEGWARYYALHLATNQLQDFEKWFKRLDVKERKKIVPPNMNNRVQYALSSILRDQEYNYQVEVWDRWMDAEKESGRAMGWHGDNVFVHAYNRGTFRSDEAIPLIAAAAEARPRDGNTYLAAARYAERRKMPGLAVEFYRKSAGTTKRHSFRQHQLFGALRRLNELKRFDEAHELALQIDRDVLPPPKQKEFDKFSSTARSAWLQTHGLAGRLVAHLRKDEFDAAVKTLGSQKKPVGPHFASGQAFDKDLQGRIPKFLEMITDPERRFYAEALLAAAPGAGRSQRLTDLANRIGEIEFTDAALERAVHAAIATELAVGAKLKPLQKTDFVLVANDWKLGFRPYVARSVEALALGDTISFSTLLKEIGESAASDHVKGETFRMLDEGLWEWAVTIGDNEATWKNLLPGFREIYDVAPIGSYDAEQKRNGARRMGAAHLMAGELESLAKWLNLEDRSANPYGVNKGGPKVMLSQFRPLFTGLPQARREELLLEWFRCPGVVGSFFSNFRDVIFLFAYDLKLVEPNDYAKRVWKIAETKFGGNDRLLWHNAARVAQQLEAKDLVVPAWEKKLASIPADHNDIHRTRFYLASSLPETESKRILELLKLVDRSKLTLGDKAAYDKLLQAFE